MNVGARRCSGHGPPKCDKRNPRFFEISDQCAAFAAVRVQAHIHRITMIKPQPVVKWRLPKGANRKLVMECRVEEVFNNGSSRKCPLSRAVKTEIRNAF